MKDSIRAFAAFVGGFALSFLGMGVLWIGTPWPIQALMFFPYFLFAYAMTRTGKSGDKPFVLILGGTMPLGLTLTLFRDKNDSHLGPIMVACAWLAGILSGHFLAARRKAE